jgi:hypothetical protein
MQSMPANVQAEIKKDGSMARKRAPGGGRKPKAPAEKKTQFTTRIDKATRALLDGEASRTGLSVSRIAEQAIDALISKKKDTLRFSEVNRALARSIMILADQIEKRTGMTWQEDAFTCEALRSGLNAVIAKFGAAGTERVPALIEERAKKLPSLGSALRNAAGFGALEAEILLYSMENAPDLLADQSAANSDVLDNLIMEAGIVRDLKREKRS